MNTRVTTAIDEAQAVKEIITDTLTLARGENAERILPSDTSFAMVARVIERDEADSFSETSLHLGVTGALSITTGGVQMVNGVYMCYFAVIDGDLALYRADSTVVVRAPLRSVRVDREHQRFVVHVSGQKFLIQEAMELTQSTIPSKVVGFNDGLNPFFNTLLAGGANVKRPSSTATAIVYGGLIAIFIAALIIMAFVDVNK